MRQSAIEPPENPQVFNFPNGTDPQIWSPSPSLTIARQKPPQSATMAVVSATAGARAAVRRHHCCAGGRRVLVGGGGYSGGATACGGGRIDARTAGRWDPPCCCTATGATRRRRGARPWSHLFAAGALQARARTIRKQYCSRAFEMRVARQWRAGVGGGDRAPGHGPHTAAARRPNREALLDAR